MTQDADNWQLLQELFFLAEATPAADREGALAEKCADVELRRRALEILRASASRSAEEPAVFAANPSGKIGPYSLIRLLGSGGIGSVYLVERMVGGAPQRSALKVLAQHAAGPSFVERFHREQHILASLDHPNITRMLDGGATEDGQPYLVMEFVDGTHLDAYCNARNLGIEERLQLFLSVCDAVAYAHRNLVVHLDLKPSNILVTESGQVKLLDFGTSKLIQPDSLLTTTVMATPAYASPEQLRNEPVTTACDIYALGAILFELLSGRRPGGQASVAMMIERAIREQESEKLSEVVTGEAAKQRGLTESRLRQLLSGDLKNVAAKCLSPRARDRYPSLDALTGDIRRFLAGMPVLARPQTVTYRLGKFVRRHRSAVAATLLVTIALVASLVYAVGRQRQALEDGQRALRMQTFMVRLFKLANSDYTGKPAATVPELLDLGAKSLPETIKDPADLRSAQISLAESMYENGDMDSAQRVFAQAIASAKSAGDVAALAEAEAYSGNIAYQQGQMDQGAALTSDALRLSGTRDVSPTVRVWIEIFYAVNRENSGIRSDENLRLMEAAVKESRDRKLPERDLGGALYALASDLELRGRLDEAEPYYNQALQLYSQDPLALCDQSEVWGDLAYLYEMRGDVQGSLPYYQRSYDGYKACAGTGSRGALQIIDAECGAMMKLGRAKEAVPLLEVALPAWRKIAGSSPDLAEPLYFLSRAYVQTGRFKDAEKLAPETIAVQTGKVVPTDRRFGVAHLTWAEALAGEHRYKEALPHAEIAVKLLNNGISAGGKLTDAEARQVLASIQKALSS